MNVSPRVWFFLLVIVVGGLLLVQLGGCYAIQKLLQNPRYIYENGAVLVGGDDEPIELLNSTSTTDVSYDQVLAFIREDITDQLQYISREQSAGLTPFVCSDFAELVHNNAEEAGIRAGYGGIDWEEGGLGHAVTVFETTDMGVVYIDCTGQSIFSQLDTGGETISNSSWDKVAYIEIGQRYGILSIEKAGSPSYEFYQEFVKKWEEYKLQLEAYNNKVRQYNADIEGKVFKAGSKEAREIGVREIQLRAEKKNLDAIVSELGTTNYKPLGIVKSITTHW